VAKRMPAGWTDGTFCVRLRQKKSAMEVILALGTETCKYSCFG
jgi:hypothetical protein